MILDIKPIPHITAVSVNGKWLEIKGIDDGQGNQLSGN